MQQAVPETDEPATSLICGYLDFDSPQANPILHATPDLIHIKNEDPARTSMLDTVLRFITTETESTQHWSISNLAEKAGMSRSAFASHFQTVSGITPMQYVTNWRMQTAFEKLRTGKDSVALKAEQSGDQTEASFRKAFKNQVGIGPGAVRCGNISPD